MCYMMHITQVQYSRNFFQEKIKIEHIKNRTHDLRFYISEFYRFAETLERLFYSFT